MGQKTKKIITKYGGLHRRSNVARLHLPRSDIGRGLESIEGCVNDERENLARYVLRSNEKLLIPSNTQLMRQAILHYVESVIKRQTV